jgi:hypothetical protein
LPVAARISDDWVLFDAPLSDRVKREDLWRLLCLNATLSGFSKFVMTPRHAIHLRADVPLNEDDESIDSPDALDANLTKALAETCSSLKEAYRIFRGEQLIALVPTDSDDRSESRAEELRRVCGETGWPFLERAGGRLMIELEVRGGFHQAVVEQHCAGICVSVEISRFDALEAIGRQAVSALLLTTGAQVRLARPSVIEETTGRFEVMFATLPTVNEFKHALSALSVACATCGQEALALRDHNIARQYLAYTGLAAGLAEASEEAMASAAD